MSEHSPFSPCQSCYQYISSAGKAQPVNTFASRLIFRGSSRRLSTFAILLIKFDQAHKGNKAFQIHPSPFKWFNEAKINGQTRTHGCQEAADGYARLSCSAISSVLNGPRALSGLRLCEALSVRRLLRGPFSRRGRISLTGNDFHCQAMNDDVDTIVDVGFTKYPVQASVSIFNAPD